MSGLTNTFTEEDLKTIGILVDGTYGGDNILIYGSNTFPVHRITVYKDRARQVLDEQYKIYHETTEAD